jgi:surface antigen
MSLRIKTARLVRITTLTVAGTATIAIAPGSALAATHNSTRHHDKSHKHGHHASGLGSGGSLSCAAGVCFSGDPFPPGQCTWYAAGRRPDLIGIVRGNAGNWLNEARGRVPEGSTPVVGAIAVWLPYHGGAFGYGHVAYVAAVAGGSVTVEDFNWEGEVHHRHTVPASWISGYIYGGPATTGSAPSPPPAAPVAPSGPPAPQPNPSPTPQPTPTPAPTPTPTPAPAPPSAPTPTPTPPPAPQYFVYHVTGTCRDGACGLTLRAGPGYSGYAAVGGLPEGAEVDVTCQATGETVSNGYASSAIWDRLTNGDWVSDFYVSTPNIGTWSPAIPQCY